MTLLRIAPEPGPEHKPVCGGCGERWPCTEERHRRHAEYIRDIRACDCWACGKEAVSRWMFGVVSPSGDVVYSMWCGQGNKRRNCHSVGQMYHDADERYREIRSASQATS
jgi:hypothetical protein